MKRKREFTKDEANKIRQLIKRKVVASKNEQKVIRNEIREIGFHFSDFSSKKGYTVEDFEELIASGLIKIIEGNKISNDKVEPIKQIVEKTINDTKSTLETTKIEELLLNEENFKKISDLNKSTLEKNGFYCIKLNSNSNLPERYHKFINQRNNRFLYLGKAEDQNLKNRLEQELEHKRPGTFFRSIGCVLNYKPIKGHLKNKSNQNNYKFSEKDTAEIIDWLNKNVRISVVEYNGDFSVEKILIENNCPLLNETHNPKKLLELREDKRICREIARQ